MKRHFAVAAVAVGLAVVAGTLPSDRARGDDPKPGTIVTVAGTGEAGFRGEKSSATQAQLFLPHGMAFDPTGPLDVADALNHRVRRVGPKGKITTWAGSGGTGAAAGGFAGDGDLAAQARLDQPHAIVFDSDGNLFILDTQNNRVRKMDTQKQITTVVGSGPTGAGTGSFAGENVPALQARLNQPAGMAMDGANNLYIADTGNHRVRVVRANGMITTFAGSGQTGAAGDSGQAAAAQLTAPYGLTFDAQGNLYLSHLAENVVRKVDSKGTITRVAGTGKPGFSGDNGMGILAQLNQPRGLAADSEGNLYIADSGNHRVRKLAKNGTITTVVGNGKPVFTEEGAVATGAGLRGPADLVIDGQGNLFIADTGFFAGSTDQLGPGERILKVIAATAPGLRNGGPF